jgi:hypothetical protein
MSNNCGHLSCRNDGIICKDCGFICCNNCNIRGLCLPCNENITADSFILNNYPNSQKCNKCKKLCRDIHTSKLEKRSFCRTLIGSALLVLAGLTGGNSTGDICFSSIYYRTLHHCRNCNIDFYNDTDKIKTKL